MFAPFFIEFQLYRYLRHRVSNSRFLLTWYALDFAAWIILLLGVTSVIIFTQQTSDANIPVLFLILTVIALGASALFTTISWLVWLQPSEKNGRGEAWLLMSPKQREEYDRTHSKDLKYSGGATTEDLRKMSRRWK